MIQTMVRQVPPERAVATVQEYIASGFGWRVVAMTTITDWQPLPNTPRETVIIVFERER